MHPGAVSRDMERANHMSCFDCSLRPDRTFCDLPADALEAFDSIKSAALYSRGTISDTEADRVTVEPLIVPVPVIVRP